MRSKQEITEDQNREDKTMKLKQVLEVLLDIRELLLHARFEEKSVIQNSKNGI